MKEKCKHEECNNDVANPVLSKGKYWIKYKECRNCTNNLTKYKITTPERDSLLAKQNYKCKICSKEISFKPSVKDKTNKDNANVDHCHKTNVIRGILCTSCNRGLGLLQDSTTILNQAIKYLNESE